MYHVSRSVYRELVAILPSKPDTPEGRRERRQLLDACEATFIRLAKDPAYFARPARQLFSETRWHFPISDQIHVWNVVRFHTEVAREIAERMQLLRRRRCEALTRKGTRCKRDTQPGRQYCRSHRHLEPNFGSPAWLRAAPVEALPASREAVVQMRGQAAAFDLPRVD